MRNDYNKNISRTSNNTCNSNSSIGSTSNRSNSNRSNSNSSNSSIGSILVMLPMCSSERDGTLAFVCQRMQCLRICRNLTFALAFVRHQGMASQGRLFVTYLKKDLGFCYGAHLVLHHGSTVLFDNGFYLFVRYSFSTDNSKVD